jgi:hypothetical protein
MVRLRLDLFVPHLALRLDQVRALHLQLLGSHVSVYILFPGPSRREQI